MSMKQLQVMVLAQYAYYLFIAVLMVLDSYDNEKAIVQNGSFLKNLGFNDSEYLPAGNL
jgi:hypothetical protein